MQEGYVFELARTREAVAKLALSPDAAAEPPREPLLEAERLTYAAQRALERAMRDGMAGPRATSISPSASSRTRSSGVRATTSKFRCRSLFPKPG